MHTQCGHCGDRIRRTIMFCPRCTCHNWNHPLMIAGKVLLALLACTAVGLIVYVGIHRDEYSGTELERLPANAPATVHPNGAGEPEEAPGPKFSSQQ